MIRQFRQGREGKFTEPAPSHVPSVLSYLLSSPVPCSWCGWDGELVLGVFPLHSQWAPHKHVELLNVFPTCTIPACPQEVIPR